ncbi:MAG: DUF1810 domain-containing protein [Gemmatimonadaceae bacterium]
MDDPHDLHRFVEAQADTYEQALAELKGGQKRTHWMWFIFPQFVGLASSAISERFSIKSTEEATAYLAHSLLGPRLRRCSEAILQLDGQSAPEIFGTPDDLKLRSSMTLFASVLSRGSIFERVLTKYFAGAADEATLRLLTPRPSFDDASSEQE